jgi:hypothetical protein
MTQISTNSRSLRRRPARSIDFDFYRKSATALRAEAMRAPRLRKVVSIVLSILCAGAVFLVVAGAARAPGDQPTITHTEAFELSENVDHQTSLAGWRARGGGSGAIRKGHGGRAFAADDAFWQDPR